jgi:hypothetical protein
MVTNLVLTGCFAYISPIGNETTRDSKLAWCSIDDESLRLDDYSLRPLPPPPHLVEENEIASPDYALALTGDVFRWMISYAPLETLQRVRRSSQKGKVNLKRFVDACKNACVCKNVAG